MKFENNKEECCGVEFEKNKFPFWGILTLAYPLYLLSGLVKWILTPLYSLLQLEEIKILNNTCIIHESNFTIIKKQAYLSKLKCTLSAFFLKSLPLLSGIIFQYFNVFFLTVCWLCIAFIFYLLRIYVI